MPVLSSLRGAQSAAGRTLRERDPLPRLPAPPRPVLATSASTTQKRAWRHQVRVWRRTIEALIGLKQLYASRLRAEDLDQAESFALTAGPGNRDFPEKWEDVSSDLRAAVSELEAAVRRVDSSGTGLCKAAAFLRLTRTPVTGYGQLSSEASGLPSRGETTSLSVWALNLPDEPLGSVRASLLSPRVAMVFQHPGRIMLRPEKEYLELAKGVKPYQDPVLADKE